MVLFVLLSVMTLHVVRVESAPLPPPGNHVISFQGTVESTGNVTPDVLYLRCVRFMAMGWKPVAEIRCCDPEAKPLLTGGWSGTGPNGSIILKSGAVGEIRCRIPTSAAGIVLDYTCPRNVEQPLTMQLGSSRALLQPIYRPYECCVFLRRGMVGVSLAPVPAYNMWSVYNTSPGPETHGEVKMKMAFTDGNDPLSCGEYRLHVWACREPDDEEWPHVAAVFQLHGVDVTRYDGFMVSVLAPHKAYAHASVIDASNFSWSGGGMQTEPNQWVRWAVPFSACCNTNTAGDGVLKLAQLSGIYVSVGEEQGKLFKEFIVGAPRFFCGNPPPGIKVIGADARKTRRPAPLEELVPLPMHRRKPMFFEGMAVQAIAIKDDTVWLGTDAGLIRTSKSKPGLQVGRWSLSDGMIDDDILAVHVDGEDLWIGATNGVSRFDGKTFTNYTSDNGLLPGPAVAITSTPEEVWVGMTRGLARFDKKAKSFAAYKRYGGWAPESTGGQGVPIQEGRGVYADTLAIDDTDGTLWHGAAGLGHSDCAGRDLGHKYGTTSRAIGIYPDGENLWYVSAGCITLQRKNGKEIKDFGLGNRVGIGNAYSHGIITRSARDPQAKVIWLAYSDGLGCFDPQRGQYYWSPAFSVALGGLVPQCLAVDEHRLWVGTDNGLVVFDKSLALQPWLGIDYACPVDLRAAGVKLGETYGGGCDTCWQYTFIDTQRGVNGSESSLCMEFALGRDKNSKVTLCHNLKMDATGTTGITFWAMSDRPRQFYVDVKRANELAAPAGTKGRNPEVETWRSEITVGPQWRQYTIPYSTMRRVSQETIRTSDRIYITGIDMHRAVKDFACPGDTGRLWIDQLGWMVENARRPWYGMK